MRFPSSAASLVDPTAAAYFFAPVKYDRYAGHDHGAEGSAFGDALEGRAFKGSAASFRRRGTPLARLVKAEHMPCLFRRRTLRAVSFLICRGLLEVSQRWYIFSASD